MTGEDRAPKIEWRPLPHFDCYEVSEYGDIRRTRTAGRHEAGRRLAGGLNQKSYRTYCINIGGSRKHVLAHRAVCEAWHGPPPFAGAHAAHWDGDKANNHYSNLRWATPAENAADQVRLGVSAKGEASANSKLTLAQVLEMRANYHGQQGEVTRLARAMGVTKSTVSKVLRGATWRIDDAA